VCWCVTEDGFFRWVCTRQPVVGWHIMGEGSTNRGAQRTAQTKCNYDSLRSHLPWSVRCALLCVDPSPILPLRFALKYGSPPLCFAQQELHRQTPQHKITQESSTAVFEATKYKKMSQHHISGNVDSFNIQDSFNKVWNNCTIADEDSEILAWLSPLEPQTRHYDIRTRRIDEVGDWLLQTEEYRNWFGGIRGGGPNSSALFCYGGPGVGKTYIR